MYNNLTTQHKVFISFYHKDDEEYKEYIEDYLCKNIINKSVQDGEYDSNNSDEYIKRLIREDKINDSSVIVVLVGPNTWKRKHVDWEISAGLSSSNGNSGLVCIKLPEFSASDKLPERLQDNIDSGYAKSYNWNYAKYFFDEIVEEAFQNRVKYRDKINNRRIQMKDNVGVYNEYNYRFF